MDDWAKRGLSTVESEDASAKTYEAEPVCGGRGGGSGAGNNMSNFINGRERL